MKNKPRTGQPLHVQIALGAKPKNVVTTRGVNSRTVPKAKPSKK